MGGAIGYSIYYNVFRQKLVGSLTAPGNLPTQIGTYAVVAGLAPSAAPTFVETWLLQGEAAAAALPGVTTAILDAAQTGSEWGYALSLHYVWYVSIAFGVLAMAAAACLPNTKRFQTNRIAVELS